MNDNIVSALRNMHANIPSGLTEVSNILSAVSQTHSGILDSAKSIVSELYAVRDEVIRPIEKLTMPAVITSITTLQSAISAVIP